MRNSGWFNEDGTVSLILTQGKVVTIDWDDMAALAPYKWYAHCPVKSIDRWYVRTCLGRFDGKRKWTDMHRLLLTAPSHLVCDHIDNNGLNNTRCNIRICTVAENGWNQRTKNGKASAARGVRRTHNNKYYVTLKKGKQSYSLRGFLCPYDAATAYNFLAHQHYGEFAYYNTVPQLWLNGIS